MCTGAHYLGGYIGYEKSKGGWLKNWTEKWESDIHSLIEMEDKCHQDIYAVAARAVQSEWLSLQRVTKDMVQALAGLETFLWETFLLRLFFGKSKILPPVIGALIALPVKKYGMGLQNPVTSEKEKHDSLLCVSCDLIGTVTSKRAFSTDGCC